MLRLWALGSARHRTGITKHKSMYSFPSTSTKCARWAEATNNGYLPGHFVIHDIGTPPGITPLASQKVHDSWPCAKENALLLEHVTPLDEHDQSLFKSPQIQIRLLDKYRWKSLNWLHQGVRFVVRHTRLQNLGHIPPNKAHPIRS